MIDIVAADIFPITRFYIHIWIFLFHTQHLGASQMILFGIFINLIVWFLKELQIFWTIIFMVCVERDVRYLHHEYRRIFHTETALRLWSCVQLDGKFWSLKICFIKSDCVINNCKKNANFGTLNSFRPERPFILKA